MAYGNTTNYQMAELRAYAEPEAGSVYKVGTATLAEDATMPGGTMIGYVSGVPTPITTGSTGALTGTNFTPTTGEWSNKQLMAPAFAEDLVITNNTANKVPLVKAIEVRLGNMYPQPNITGITAADFTDGSMTLKISYGGKCYLGTTPSDIYAYLTDANGVTYTAGGVDYTLTPTLEHVESGDVLTVKIDVTEDGNLNQCLANSGVLTITLILKQIQTQLTEGVDYIVRFAKNISGKLEAYVRLIPPAGYAGIAAGIRVSHSPKTFSGGIPEALTMYDSAAGDPRTITVYTGGVFKKSAVSNYQDFFNVTGFEFI